jgi:hypothetical protein
MAQGTPEWLALRAGKFTGSRFSDLMAKTKSGPSTSRRNLISTLARERRYGPSEDSYCNFAMQRGKELEPDAIKAYENKELVAVDLVDFIQHSDLEYVGVSPDGMIGETGMIEVKCPLVEAKHYEALRYGAHVKEYHWQLQGQLWVAGREWVDAVSYDPRFKNDSLDDSLAVVRVYRDEKAIKELAIECVMAEKEVLEQLAWFENRA